MKKFNSSKSPIAFYVAIALFVLLALSMNVSTNLYARYFTTDDGSDGARVAKFEITDELASGVVPQYVPFTMRPDETQQFTFQIANNSEVALCCTVVGTSITNNLPVVIPEVSVNIRAGEVGDVTVTVSWPIVTEGVDVSTDSSYYSDKIDILRFSVTVEQID